jgi:transcriptional regulator GlxA family with amidase domain
MADPMRRTDGETPPRRFVFVLLDQFTMLCFSSAVEALRIANRMSGRAALRMDAGGRRRRGRVVQRGIGFKLDSDLDEVTRDDTVLVCGGIDVQAATTKRVIGWLRREARKGPVMGGLCTAGYTLAKAGLLDGKRATIHWENQDSFAEEFEDVT